MELINVTEENIEKEHICCAIAGSNDSGQAGQSVRAKKEWMKARFADGFVFKKLDVRGKCFIEYIPAEKAWAPIEAPGYMYIDCLWVSGQYKGKGYSNLLLNACISDAEEKGKKGLVILSAKKKMSFLADPKYLRYKGFRTADTAEPYFELMYLPFDTDAQRPRFTEKAKHPRVETPGYVLYYTHQCPFTSKYVPLLSDVAARNNAAFTAVRFETTEQAKAAPAPFTTFGLFYNGDYVTNEILSEKKFEKMIAEHRGQEASDGI